jgi:hypothetical protein
LEIKPDQVEQEEQKSAPEKHKESTSKSYKSYLTSKNLGFALHVSSFLPGCNLFHKIAVLSRRMRKELPDSVSLDQEVELSLRVHSKRIGLRDPKTEDFSYGFKLATVINFDSLVNHENTGDKILNPIHIMY